jgi:hypothetical protein
MLLPTRQLVLSAALGAALAATAPTAQGQGPGDPVKPLEPAELKKQLDDIRADVKALQTFRKDLEDLVYGKGDGKTDADKGLMRRMTDLERLMKSLDEKLTGIDAKLGDLNKSTSLRPGAPLVTGRAFVRLVNDYPTEVSLMLNGRSHRLLPGEVKTVEVPPGSYTYELLSAGSQPATDTLRDGQSITLRIR